MTDDDIIKSIVSGNKNNFRLIVDKHQQLILRTCMGYVHNQEDASDLTQETFINAYQNLRKFRFNSEVSTWLIRIAINVSLNFLRSKKRTFIERIEDLFEAKSNNRIISDFNVENPEQLLISDEHRAIIQKELNKLSEKQKTAFILSKYDMLPQKEIAAVMQITEGTVESLIQRAKANLRKQLANYFKKK